MRIRTWALAVPLLAGGLTAATSYKAPVPECVVAAKWAAAHKGNLPTTLADLSTYPRVYRRAIVNNLPHEQQLALWHEHFATFLNSGRLTKEQDALLRDIVAHVDEYFSREGVLKFDSLYKDRAIATFGRALATDILAKLGPDAPADAASGRRAGGPSAAAVTPIANCECSTGSDWCSFGSNCGYQASCPGDMGCGTLGQYLCNGECAIT